jgi:hypothetical protein
MILAMNDLYKPAFNYQANGAATTATTIDV